MKLQLIILLKNDIENYSLERKNLSPIAKLRINQIFQAKIKKFSHNAQVSVLLYLFANSVIDASAPICKARN